MNINTNLLVLAGKKLKGEYIFATIVTLIIASAVYIMVLLK